MVLHRVWLSCNNDVTEALTGYLNSNYSINNLLPNQELSGAKSELQEETVVGVCSFYKRGDQPPYNSALRSLQMFLFVYI